ncbi:hypothetical protein ABPG72_009032 [Tetrahymena utriculariae]
MSVYNDVEISKLKEDVNSLAATLKKIKWDIDTQRNQAKQLNQNESEIPTLFKLKKTFLLSRIFIFLSDQDIMVLALVNKSLYKLIYSPIGYKILFFTRSQYAQRKLVQVLQNDELDKQKKLQNQGSGLDSSSVTALMERFNSAKYESGEDFEAQLMTFKHTMQILADELHKKIEQNAYLQDNIKNISDELFQEKTNHDKYVTKIKILNDKVHSLESQVEDKQKESLHQQEQQMAELLQLQGQKKKLLEENEQLIAQNSLLEQKLTETQTQLEQVQKTKDLYLESLKNFRNLIVDVKY